LTLSLKRGRAVASEINAALSAASASVRPNYAIRILRDDLDWYVADVPDLSECRASGKTPEEALENVESEIGSRLAEAEENGSPFPKASYRPVIYQLSR